MTYLQLLDYLKFTQLQNPERLSDTVTLLSPDSGEYYPCSLFLAPENCDVLDKDHMYFESDIIKGGRAILAKNALL